MGRRTVSELKRTSLRITPTKNSRKPVADIVIPRRQEVFNFDITDVRQSRN